MFDGEATYSEQVLSDARYSCADGAAYSSWVLLSKVERTPAVESRKSHSVFFFAQIARLSSDATKGEQNERFSS